MMFHFDEHRNRLIYYDFPHEAFFDERIINLIQKHDDNLSDYYPPSAKNKDYLLNHLYDTALHENVEWVTLIIYNPSHAKHNLFQSKKLPVKNKINIDLYTIYEFEVIQ